MATIAEWTGKSGTRYEFEVYEVGTPFNNVPGVYIACRPLVSRSLEALYVGETQSFYDRLNAGLKNHDGLRCAARNGMTHIAVRSVADYSNRLRVETDLRHGLNPSCNKQGVSTLNPSSLFYGR